MQNTTSPLLRHIKIEGKQGVLTGFRRLVRGFCRGFRLRIQKERGRLKRLMRVYKSLSALIVDPKKAQIYAIFQSIYQLS
jgi:hypothetical protein